MFAKTENKKTPLYPLGIQRRKLDEFACYHSVSHFPCEKCLMRRQWEPSRDLTVATDASLGHRPFKALLPKAYSNRVPVCLAPSDNSLDCNREFTCLSILAFWNWVFLLYHKFFSLSTPFSKKMKNYSQPVKEAEKKCIIKRKRCIYSFTWRRNLL